MADEEPKKNEGTFYCKCLWSGTLSFTPEEVQELEGEIRRYMGPCPECGKNSLQLAQDPLEGHNPRPNDPRQTEIDGLLDEVEGRVGGDAGADLFADDKEDLDV